jgi:hypothetical protein
MSRSGSRTFRDLNPRRPHRASLLSEVGDLRKDIQIAFERLEQESVDYPLIEWLDGTAIPAAGGDVVIRGSHLLQGQTFAHIHANTGLEIYACIPGEGGNDYSVAIVQGSGALAVAMTAKKLTITLAAAPGGSTRNAVATALNDAAADNYQILRANVTAGGGSLVTVLAETHLTGGDGDGWECYVSGELAPIMHTVGGATTTANNVAEGVATVTVPNLTGVSPARAAADRVRVHAISDGVYTNDAWEVLG